MPAIVKVTPVQVRAAQLKVKRASASGKPIPRSVAAIANAKRATGRNGEEPRSAE